MLTQNYDTARCKPALRRRRPCAAGEASYTNDEGPRPLCHFLDAPASRAWLFFPNVSWFL